MEHKNRVLHVTLEGGHVRALLCDTTGMARQARDIHNASDVVSVAMGRMISGVAMMGAQLKGAEESLSVTLRGGGPAGAMTAVVRNNTVKITIDNPQVELPLRADGQLDVGAALGRQGRLTVVRDLGFGEPYVGQVNLASGEVAEDFTMYYAASEQTPALCALGVLIGGEGITSAGGVLIQAMPGCPEKVLDALELRSPLFSDISKTLSEVPLEEVAKTFFDGLSPEILEETPLTLACDCSRQRIEKALLAMGQAELEDLLRTMGGAELTCHFCNKKYNFNGEQLAALIAEGKGREQGH